MSQILNKKQMSEEDIKFHYITPAITSSCHCNNITTVIHRCWLQNDQADCSRQNDRFHDRVQANHRSWHQTPWKTWQNALHGTLIVKGYFTQFTKKTQNAGKSNRIKASDALYEHTHFRLYGIGQLSSKQHIHPLYRELYSLFSASRIDEQTNLACEVLHGFQSQLKLGGN